MQEKIISPAETEIANKLEAIIIEIKKDIEEKINRRIKEIESEESDFYELFEVLGFNSKEAEKIDKYHNIGRLIFRSSAGLIEEVTTYLLKITKNCHGMRITNPMPPPKEFNIDAVNEEDKKAIEIKWRHATTDGDHVNKEIQKPISIRQKGYTPVHLVFYTSKRENAIKALDRIIKSYEENDGEVYIGEKAWEFIKDYTEFDLKSFLYKFKVIE